MTKQQARQVFYEARHPKLVQDERGRWSYVEPPVDQIRRASEVLQMSDL
jgi:hypothetical protein